MKSGSACLSPQPHNLLQYFTIYDIMLKISSEGRGFSMPPIQEKRYLISSNDLDDIKRYIRDKRRPGAFLGMVDNLISVEEDKDEISMKP